MIVAFEIIIDVVFGRIVIVVVVVVNCENSTLSGRTPAVGIIIVKRQGQRSYYRWQQGS